MTSHRGVFFLFCTLGYFLKWTFLQLVSGGVSYFMVTARVRPTYVGAEPLPAVESARAAADENRQPGRSRDMIEVNEGFLGFSKGFISGGFLGPSRCYITPTAVIQSNRLCAALEV